MSSSKLTYVGNFEETLLKKSKIKSRRVRHLDLFNRFYFRGIKGVYEVTLFKFGGRQKQYQAWLVYPGDDYDMSKRKRRIFLTAKTSEMSGRAFRALAWDRLNQIRNTETI